MIVLRPMLPVRRPVGFLSCQRANRFIKGAQHPLPNHLNIATNNGHSLLLRTRTVGGCRHMAQFVKPQYWAAHMRLFDYSDEELKAWKEEFTNLNGYSLSDLATWRNAFDLVDKDRDGYISQADLQKNPSFPIERVKLFKEYDLDRNNLIDFGEFVEAMFSVDCTGLRDYFEGFDTIDIKLEYEKFAVTQPDTNRKVITLDGVKRLMNAHDFTVITDVDAQRLFNILDKNYDGVIDSDDFRKWLLPHI